MDYLDAAAAGPVQISRKLCSPVFSAIARRSDMMPGFVKIAGNADLRFSGLQISCLRKRRSVSNSEKRLKSAGGVAGIARCGVCWAKNSRGNAQKAVPCC
jgi:hypothetical protein